MSAEALIGLVGVICAAIGWLIARELNRMDNVGSRGVRQGENLSSLSTRVQRLEQADVEMAGKVDHMFGKLSELGETLASLNATMNSLRDTVRDLVDTERDRERGAANPLDALRQIIELQALLRQSV